MPRERGPASSFPTRFRGYDRDAVDLPPHLEASPRTEEPREPGEHRVGVGPQPDDRGEVGGARVEDVVRTGYLEAEEPLRAVVDDRRREREAIAPRLAIFGEKSVGDE